MTKKAPSRFSAWQEAKQVRRESIIDEYLIFLAKTRVKVRHVTDLADLVAKHITQIEGKPCNKATLLRNTRYKARLLTYQANSLSPGAKSLNSRAVTDPTAKALVTSAQLESGNLKRELERLNIYVTSLEQQVDQFQSKGRQFPSRANIAASTTRIPKYTSDEEPQPHKLALSDHELMFIRTCQALRAVVSHLSLVLEVDMSSRQILDKSRRRNNVVVDEELAGPFIDWLRNLSGVRK